LDYVVGPFENLGDLLIEGEIRDCLKIVLALAFLIGDFLIGASLVGGDAFIAGMAVDSLV